MNIKAMLKKNEDEKRACQAFRMVIHHALYGDGFWKPIFKIWLMWTGCSWAVLAAIWLCPKLMKLMLKTMGL